MSKSIIKIELINKDGKETDWSEFYLGKKFDMANLIKNLIDFVFEVEDKIRGEEPSNYGNLDEKVYKTYKIMNTHNKSQKDLGR